jgi:hypothetical protein
VCGQSRSNSCACSSGAVAELCNYPASDSTVPSLGVLLPCAELGREEKEWKRPGGRKDHFQRRSSIFRASSGAICQCNADLPPDTPKGERDLLILFLEDDMKFQEDFCRGILSVFRLAKEPTANVQDEGIVRGMN